MKNEKPKRGRRVDQSGILAALLAFIDLALLVWIGISYYEIRQKEQLAAYYADLYAVSQQAAPEITQSPETDAPVSPPAVGGNPEPEAEPETEPETDPIPDRDAAAVYGTSERPETEDFEIWFGHNVSGQGIPQDARTITDFREIAGSWKVLLRYDVPEDSGGSTVELLNYTVSGDEASAAVTADRYKILPAGEGEWLSEEEAEDEVYTGSWNDGSLLAAGSGEIRITVFYEYDGRQFGAGQFLTPDGENAATRSSPDLS